MPGAGHANGASATRFLASLMSFLLTAFGGPATPEPRRPGLGTWLASRRGILPIVEAAPLKAASTFLTTGCPSNVTPNYQWRRSK